MATPRECSLLNSYRLASFHKLRRHRRDRNRSCSQGLPHRSGLHQQYEPLHSLHQRPMVAPRASCCWTVSPVTCTGLPSGYTARSVGNGTSSEDWTEEVVEVVELEEEAVVCDVVAVVGSDVGCESETPPPYSTSSASAPRLVTSKPRERGIGRTSEREELKLLQITKAPPVRWHFMMRIPKSGATGARTRDQRIMSPRL